MRQSVALVSGNLLPEVASLILHLWLRFALPRQFSFDFQLE
jgi:hypothetical protein